MKPGRVLEFVGIFLAGGSLLFAADAPPKVGSWETFGNGPARAGYYPATIGPNLFVASWWVGFPTPVNQVAVANGKVFYTTTGFARKDMEAGAIDVATGDALWRFPLGEASWISGPTFSDGRLYFQRSNRIGDTHLWCLDAESGDLRWTAAFAVQGGRYLSPAIDAGRVWIGGGYNGSGMFGFDAETGSQLFYKNITGNDQWTPAIYDGHVFMWVDSDLQAWNASAGTLAWSRRFPGATDIHYRTVAIRNGYAYKSDRNGLRACNLLTRSSAWEIPERFTGTAAVDDTTVYGLSGSSVKAYDAKTGQFLGSYIGTSSLMWQPIVTNDRVMAASASQTFIFDKDSRQLLQTLPVGGCLSYAGGRLFITSDTVGNGASRISTFAIQLTIPETPPQPTPTPTPEPTPNPTPAPTPAPDATPIAAVTSAGVPAPPSPAGPSWTDAQISRGVAYFLFSKPARIERFDLARQQWLQTVTLNSPAGAFTVDGDAIYVASANKLWSLDRNGQNPRNIFNTDVSIKEVLSADGILYAIASDPFLESEQFTSLEKSTGRPVDVMWTGSRYYTFRGSSIARKSGAIFSRTATNSPPDILRVTAPEGRFVTWLDSPYHGTYPNASKTFVFPDEEKVADNAGIIYNASDLAFSGSFGGAFKDLRFYGERPVLLRGNSVVSFSKALAQTGAKLLQGNPMSMALHADNAFVFYPAGPRGVWALRMPLTFVNLPSVSSSPDPGTLEYVPDAVAVGDGVVYLLSRQHLCIFRWSIANGQYIGTIHLTAAPSHMAYSAAASRLYMGYPSGRVSFFVDGVPGAERTFAQLPGKTLGLATAGGFVFAVDSTGPQASHYIFSEDGQLLSSKNANNVSDEFVWSPANRKMYFLRDGISPNDLLWEEIDEQGVLGDIFDSPYHSSTGVSHPIRLSPDGTSVLLGSGRIFDGITLSLIGELSNPVTDGVWTAEGLYTMRAWDGSTQVQAWVDPEKESFRQWILDGLPLRLLDIEEGILAITVVDGRPVFERHPYLFDSEPEPRPTPRPVPTPTPMPSSVSTGLAMSSEAGDFIGQGKSYFFASADVAFSAEKNSKNGVSIRIGDRDWSLDFAAANEVPLAPGTYLRAVRFPFNGPNQPGLDISGEGRGSNELTGWFHVKQVAFDGETVTAFWATFEQHSEGMEPALTGEIRFNADVPSDPEPTPDPTPTPTPEPTPTPNPTPVVTPTPLPPHPTPAQPTPKPRPDKPKPDKRDPRVTVEGERKRTTTFDFAFLSGRVTDNRRVKRMEIRGGGARYVRPVRGTDRWYQLVDVRPGRNVFRVRAQDAAGNYSKPQRVVIVRQGY